MNQITRTPKPGEKRLGGMCGGDIISAELFYKGESFGNVLGEDNRIQVFGSMFGIETEEIDQADLAIEFMDKGGFRKMVRFGQGR